MEIPLYTVKSNTSRILTPKIIRLLGLAILLYIGVWLNSILINKPIPSSINYLIIVMIFILVLIETILIYNQTLKSKYYFFYDSLF